MKHKMESAVDPQHKGFFHTRLFKVVCGLFAIMIILILYNCIVRDTPSTPEEEAEQQAKEMLLDTFDVVGDYLFKTPEQSKVEEATDEQKAEQEQAKKEMAKESGAKTTEKDDHADDEMIESADISSDTKPAPPAPEVKKPAESTVEKMESPQVAPIE